MEPPVCAVCEQDATTTVRFRARPEDLAWRARFEGNGHAGHPPDTAWVCADHVADARGLAPTHTIDTALRELASPASRSADQVELAALVAELVPQLAGVAARLGIAAPAVVQSTTRTWTAMDGAEAPWCPYVDSSNWRAGDASLGVELHWERAHWNADELAQTNASLDARMGAGGSWRVGMYAQSGSARLTRGDVSTTGDVDAEILALLTTRGLI